MRRINTNYVSKLRCLVLHFFLSVVKALGLRVFSNMGGLVRIYMALDT